MCKLHKDVAIVVAKNLNTGEIDPLIYSITLCALAKFWIDKYIPDMSHIDGYSDYEMSTPDARKLYHLSGLEQEVAQIKAEKSDRKGFLRQAAEQIITEQRLTLVNLHLPKNPETSPRFLDKVMLDIYEGDPRQELSLKPVAGKPEFEPMRRVIETIYQNPSYQQALENSLKLSISNLFTNAPNNISPDLLKLYSCFSVGLRTSFASCSLHSGGGVMTHAVVCGGLNTAIGGLSTTLMNTAMYAVAPVVAVGTTYAVEKYRMNDFNPYKFIVPVVLSLSAAFAVSKFLPHEHSADPKMASFYGLNPQQRQVELQSQYKRYLNLSIGLRSEIEKEAKRQDMSISMFMASLNVCGGDLTPRINEYERKNTLNSNERELKR